MRQTSWSVNGHTDKTLLVMCILGLQRCCQCSVCAKWVTAQISSRSL